MRTTYSWIARFYVSGSVLVTTLIALLDERSASAEVLQIGTGPGFLAATMLAAVAIAGLLDVFINDWLPARFSLRCTHRHRHVVFMLMGIGQVGLIYVMARRGHLEIVTARYALDAVVAVFVAAYGVHEHKLKPRGTS